MSEIRRGEKKKQERRSTELSDRTSRENDCDRETETEGWA